MSRLHGYVRIHICRTTDNSFRRHRYPSVNFLISVVRLPPSFLAKPQTCTKGSAISARSPSLQSTQVALDATLQATHHGEGWHQAGPQGTFAVKHERDTGGIRRCVRRFPLGNLRHRKKNRVSFAAARVFPVCLPSPTTDPRPPLTDSASPLPLLASSLFAQYHQYHIVGRHVPTEADPNPQVFRMKLWSLDDVRARSKFW